MHALTSFLPSIQARPSAETPCSLCVQPSSLQYTVLQILSALVFLGSSQHLLHSGSPPAFAWLLPLFAIAWKFSHGSKRKWWKGSGHWFSITQKSLSLFMWCPVSSKLSFHIFCLFYYCFRNKVSLGPMISSGLKVDVSAIVNGLVLFFNFSFQVFIVNLPCILQNC